MKRINWKCQNCRAEVYGDPDLLPEGWRWFAMSDMLEGHMDDIEATLVCGACVKRIDAALKFEKNCGGAS